MSDTRTSTIQASPRPKKHATTVGRVLGRLRRQPGTIVAAAFILLLVVVAVAAPLLAPFDPNQAHFDHVLQAPDSQFLLGTDDLGQDQLSRLIYGARIVLLVALGAVLIAIAIGVPLGLVFGFNGGWWDRIGMRFVDMGQSLPGMLIGITVITILGRNMFILMLAIGIIFSMAFARMTRATVLSERKKLYVEAAEVTGLRRGQIIFGQVLPNLVGGIITQAAVFLGSAIMIESAMSFLGIGLDRTTPTWGAMLSFAVEKQNVAPYLTWAPGIAIVLTVLAFSVFGDGLNDALIGERRRLPRLGLRSGPAAEETPVQTARRASGGEASVPASAPAPDPAPDAILHTRGVTVSLARPDGEQVEIVKRVCLDVAKGEIVGLLGESGSGKSTFARAVLGMLPAGTWLSGGSIRIAGAEIAGRPERELRGIRGSVVGAVFQDPATALSPVHTVGAQLVEPLRIHQGMNRAQARARAVELLERVGVQRAASRLDDYPHQFSGGMAQRVAIAMALAADPELLIADEATSALDVTTQSQVLDLILDLRAEYGMGVLMITHSLGVVAETCDRAAVMYRGRIVEDAPVGQLFDAPGHRYTQALLAANPMKAAGSARLSVIDGSLRAEIDADIDDLDRQDAVAAGGVR
ncbi:dipeptide/oligopeptide/nickel ABC transporter permease/ATP-binding protein [Microbacterium oxydans]|uniref:dipeptide/oligopeptide/nickel ABC transporter permease/ATP-binding protein n=1 Tax=Microbacterium oxydans TaxID=82380 RepID=UPI00226B461C|nr:dipeptide/oligopeptide/nickel ABC transporter permease/ATP-binding protein [Microbacterium oxydans]WAA66513.1 dipeptide/oligopeptide/nickel ABC transporter permease/ATP-binding protein [Microbacterium oxydans]